MVSRGVAGRLEATPQCVRVVPGDVTVAETVRTLRFVETGHSPTYCIPPEDARRDCPEAVPGVGSICEWKGAARYFSISAGGRRALRCAWSYPEPASACAALKEHLALYVAAMDATYREDELAQAQPGGFYLGRFTSDNVGPSKGEPGTEGW